jgi:hypothetical protein
MVRSGRAKLSPLMPAQAGVRSLSDRQVWIPAFAGMGGAWIAWDERRLNFEREEAAADR